MTKATSAERMAKKRAKDAKAGLCIVCGKNKPPRKKPGKPKPKVCTECNKTAAERVRRSRKRAK